MPTHTPDPKWCRRSACRFSLLDFFDERKQVPEKKAICKSCPVQTDCFFDAISSVERNVHEQLGVRAGTVRADRQHIRHNLMAFLART